MLYLVDIDNGSHLLFTEEKVLVNQYTGSGSEYDAFENGMNAVAEAYDVKIKELTLSNEHCEIVEEMFEELGCDDSTHPIAKYVLAHAEESS